MSRSSRIDQEAKGLWSALTNEPPPEGLTGEELLSAALKLKPAVDYDRIYSPHLRAGQITGGPKH